MPPMVHWAAVLTSTGNQTPCGLSQAFRWSSTIPGWTVTVIAARSKSVTWLRYLLLSRTSASPTVWPHWLVPAPRCRIGTRRSPAMAIASATSCSVRGTNTPTGWIW